MKKLISGLMLASFLVSAPLAYASAEDSTSTIELLLQQIEILKAQIETIQEQITILQAARGQIKETKEEVKDTLKLIKSLSRGMRGEEVTMLQEILATDPGIYPEGLVTGYFGPLTERAVKKFQQKAGIETVGVVGPKTKAKINELLEEGAGKSGKVPPGLLIAPGIRKKLGYTPEVPAGQDLPPGIAKKVGTPGEEDEVPPVISDVISTSTTANSSIIQWSTDEEATSKVYYGTSTPLDTTTASYVEESALVLEHELTLSGLTASTTYYFVVSSADASSNESTSSEESFTTQ